MQLNFQGYHALYYHRGLTTGQNVLDTLQDAGVDVFDHQDLANTDAVVVQVSDDQDALTTEVARNEAGFRKHHSLPSSIEHSLFADNLLVPHFDTAVDFFQRLANLDKRG